MATRNTFVTEEQLTLKQGLKTAVYGVLGATSWATGATWIRRSLNPHSSLKILIYYKINDLSGNTLSTPLKIFESQMRFLTMRYHVISPEELIQVIEQGRPLPPRAVLLTFDDGYRDVFDAAYPILKQYGLKAALFPATDFIGTGRDFPHDERLPMRNPPLEWDQIRQMLDVFTIGSHTKSHRRLTAISPLEAREEIVASKAVLEDRLGRPVRLFSYPKGTATDLSLPLEELVREAGYLASFVALTGPNSLGRVRKGQWLRRYHVEPFMDFMFARLLDGSCDAIGLKDLRWGCSAKHTFNQLLGTDTR